MEKYIRFPSIYLVKCGNFDLYKIGWTKCRKLKNRLENLQVGCPFEIIPLAYKEIRGYAKYGTSNAEVLEKTLHRKYWKQRVRGEWFKLNKEQVEWIIRTLS